MSAALANVPVLILAGGLGTRLRSVVSDVPKVLADINGKPYLHHLLAHLRKSDLAEAVLCTGYMADKVEQRIGTSCLGMKISYSVEDSPLGTGGALRKAAELTEADTVLALNGDSFCGADLEQFHDFHSRRRADASMLLIKLEDTGRFGRVAVDDNSFVAGYFEKTQSGPGWINAGIYLLKRELLLSLPAGKPLSIEKEVFPGWTEKRMIHGYRAENAAFIDIGTPESYVEAASFFAAHR